MRMREQLQEDRALAMRAGFSPGKERKARLVGRIDTIIHEMNELILEFKDAPYQLPPSP
jgi:hypothetical protein